MNLFHQPTLSELSGLIAHCKNCSKYFNLIVDYDGEVLIIGDSNKMNKGKELLKYKFHIRGMSGIAFVGSIAAENLSYLNQLYKNLLFAWEREMKGAIDFKKISRLQNLNYWLEINWIPYGPLENEIISVLFKDKKIRGSSIRY